MVGGWVPGSGCLLSMPSGGVAFLVLCVAFVCACGVCPCLCCVVCVTVDAGSLLLVGAAVARAGDPLPSRPHALHPPPLHRARPQDTHKICESGGLYVDLRLVDRACCHTARPSHSCAERKTHCRDCSMVMALQFKLTNGDADNLACPHTFCRHFFCGAIAPPPIFQFSGRPRRGGLFCELGWGTVFWGCRLTLPLSATRLAAQVCGSSYTGRALG